MNESLSRALARVERLTVRASATRQPHLSGAEFSRRYSAKGGRARVAAMTPEELSAANRHAALVRWHGISGARRIATASARRIPPQP